MNLAADRGKPMKLTIEQVEHIAKLARLELKPEEKELFTRQLSSILEYVDKLSQVDTKGVEPLSHSIALENVLRPDEVRPASAETRRRLLENFPEKTEDLLKVQGVFS